MQEIKVLGIVGSLRKSSYNRSVLKTAQVLVSESPSDGSSRSS